MRRKLELGERVYLVPRTIGAPAICYKQPRVTVVALAAGRAYATVELDNGDQHEIHLDNIRITAPKPPKPRRSTAPRCPLVLPDGWEKMPLC